MTWILNHWYHILALIWCVPGFFTWATMMVVGLADEKSLRQDIQFFRLKNIPSFIVFFILTLFIFTALGWLMFIAFFLLPDEEYANNPGTW